MVTFRIKEMEEIEHPKGARIVIKQGKGTKLCVRGIFGTQPEERSIFS